MTFTVSRPGPPRRGGPSSGTRQRVGVVYGYNLMDPDTGRVVIDDYVGQTRNLAQRDRQHRGLAAQRDGQVREQPWSDLIVGGPHILEQGWWSNAELDARERYWIGVRRPRQNCRENEHNPARIPIYVQRQLRDARDVAAGRPVRDWSRSSAPFGGEAPPSDRSWLAATRPARTAKRRLHTAARVVVPWVVGVPAVWATLWLVAVLALHQPARVATSNVTSTLIAAAIVYGLARTWWASRTRPKRHNRRRTR